MKKKIYSLTILAYVQTVTGIKPDMHYEYDKQKGRMFFGVYKLTEEVQKAIDNYHTRNDSTTIFMDFLANLNDITERKNKIKDALNQWNS